jgi:hypothetical protein
MGGGRRGASAAVTTYSWLRSCGHVQGTRPETLRGADTQATDRGIRYMYTSTDMITLCVQPCTSNEHRDPNYCLIRGDLQEYVLPRLLSDPRAVIVSSTRHITCTTILIPLLSLHWPKHHFRLYRKQLVISVWQPIITGAQRVPRRSTHRGAEP